MPVDRCEPHVGDLVELLQLFHDERADFVRADFFLGAFLQRALDAIGDRLERGDADRPLFARLEQPGDELLPLEALARAVLLHDHVRNLVDPLVTREALAAAETFPATTDDFALAALARVDNFIAEVRTVGTLHSSVPEKQEIRIS
jgi:hypothetical protein